MSKQPTLLNFFQKVSSPKVQDQNEKVGENGGEFKTPKKVVEKKGDLSLCEVVWAKLEGYPWWPSLVCQHPKTKKYLKAGLVHVQFFDNPPTRAWISKKCIEKYSLNSSKRNPKGYSDTDLKNLKRACEEADRAFQLPVKEREDLLVDFSDVSASEEESKAEESSPDNNKENHNGIEEDEEEEDEKQPKKKRRVFVFDSEDSDDEYKPDKHEESDDDDDDDEPSGDDSNLSEIVEEEEEVEETPPKGVKRKRNHSVTSSRKKTCLTPTSSGNISRGSTTKAKLSLFKNQSNGSVAKKQEDEKSDDWPHLKLEFLQPDKIMDKEKRRPDHPDYDKRTLYVPEEYKAKVTPAVRQWWELKSDHFDCILFFKVGKFYELYHMDAVVGVNELSLTFMKGDFAHSGFPEISYGRFSTILVQKGYKVARVEQTETPEMMTERCKLQGKTTKFDKVVSREICQVTTKGTQIFSFIDGEAKESETNYLLAIAEKVDNLDRMIYGVCFIDTSIGTFHIGQFHDDKFLSRLRTLLSHHPPVQILYEKYQVSGKTMQLLRNSFSNVLQEPLAAESEFWSATKTLTTLAEENHFAKPNESGTVWPEAIKKFLNPADSLGLSTSDDGELAIKALGACVWYLKQCFLDQQLLAMNKFEIYSPVDDLTNLDENSDAAVDLGRYMVLDGLTLTNLEVLTNSNGDKSGTLLERLDHCCTFSGKRLIRQWLCSPLCSIPAIISRQEAIEELLCKAHVVQEVRTILKRVPDVERLLGKIHTQGNAIRSKTHPDSRAILFEDKVYSKRKIQDFLSALAGFEKIQNVIETLQKESWKSKLLQQCIMHSPEGKFKDLKEHLSFFKTAFDHDLAKKEGCIIPRSSGIDPEYDAVMEELKNIETESNAYLKSQCRHFGTTVKYFGSDKNRFQLEVPEAQAKKAESEYEFTSCRKGFKRFMTDETKNFLRRQKQAEETKSVILKDLSRRVFAQFSDKYEDWTAAIQCLSLLDVLMSLAEYCRSEGGEMCVPEFVKPTPNEKPFIDVRNGRHPCLNVDNGFIPNDIKLGVDSFKTLVLLTGPNMGGKSTLMRQLGLIAIMAQIGLKVPAESCKMLPINRIFTRIGAKDDILAGESTFYVELSEASLILNSASRYSLVLMDELGRGTSTYDGTAIAYSVVRKIAEKECRTLFSTHYHTLVEDFKNSEAVTLGHMACMVESDEEDPSEETVTFLYKFISGACPKSYGFNAAKLAGVPTQIIKAAREKTTLLEKEAEKRRVLKKIFGSKDCSSEELTQLLKSIQLAC